MLSEMTARELRAINPAEQDYIEAVEILVAMGWKFKSGCGRPGVPWNEGWWINAEHPTKNRPVGDSKNFHIAAWDTLKAYVVE